MSSEQRASERRAFESRALTDKDLQKYLCKFTYFPECLDWLLGPARDATVLGALIENTHRAVQRERPMGWSKQLTRTDYAEAVDPEARWERAIWRKWRPYKGHMPVTKFHELASWILTYQLPLYGRQETDGWGKIDLVGVSQSYLPVVIELKAEGSDESPLAAVLEAVRYGVALRELWNFGLREEWNTAIEQTGLVPSRAQPQELDRIQLMCVAPSDYWDRRGPMTSSGEQHRRAWPALRELCDRLATKHQLHVEFVKVEFSTNNLPR